MRANRFTEAACVLQENTSRAIVAWPGLAIPDSSASNCSVASTRECKHEIKTCRVRTEVATRGEPLWFSGLLRTSGVLAQSSSPPVPPEQLKETGLQGLLRRRRRRRHCTYNSVVSCTPDPTNRNRLFRHLYECTPPKRERYVSAGHPSQSRGIRIVPCRQRCTCTDQHSTCRDAQLVQMPAKLGPVVVFTNTVESLGSHVRSTHQDPCIPTIVYNGNKH